MSAQSRAFATAAAQRRLTTVRAKRQVIDPVRLAELAGNPALKSGSIARQFGYGRATFFTYLTQHEELWAVYEKARLGCGKTVARAFFRAATRSDSLTADDVKITDAIAGGARTLTAIQTASKVDPRVFSARLYDLENERHEIWSTEVGRPPVTHYFLREESEKAKGRAA